MIKNKYGHHRGLIVPHPAQRSIFLRIVLVLLALLIVSGGFFYVLAGQRLEAEYFKAHSQIKNTMEMFLPWMLTVYIGGLVAASFFGMLVSRKLAGPLVSFRRSLGLVAKGDFGQRINLRQQDDYHGLAKDLNQLLDQFSEKLLVQKQVREELIILQKRLPVEAAGEFHSILEKLDRSLEDVTL